MAKYTNKLDTFIYSLKTKVDQKRDRLQKDSESCFTVFFFPTPDKA